VDSGRVRAATTLHAGRKEYSHRWPQILADGRAWLYTALTGTPPGGEFSVIVHLPATGETRVLLAGALFARYLGHGVLLFVRDGQTLIAPFDPDRLELTGSAEAIDDPIVTRAASGATFVSVSRQGAAVFVKGGRESDRRLLWVDRAGVVQPVGAPPASYAMPRISPDGLRVAVLIPSNLSIGDMWTFDLQTHVRSRLTADGVSSGPAAWSPDSQRLIFSSLRSGQMNLVLQAADGIGAAEQLVPKATFQFVGSWLRDGHTIMYSERDQNTGFHTWRMDLQDRRALPQAVGPLLAPPAGDGMLRPNAQAGELGGRVSPMDAGWRTSPVNPARMKPS
jgi:hypothetical protein